MFKCIGSVVSPLLGSMLLLPEFYFPTYDAET